ncbi:hypothetical protein Tco_1315752 [Tanacetum coccineum]
MISILVTPRVSALEGCDRNTEEKKYILSLYKIHAEEFPKPDLEEKLNRWVRKEFKTFNEDTRLSIQHWKDSCHKRVYKQNQKKVRKNLEDYYSNHKITEVVRIFTDQLHGLDFMEQILVMRANDKPDSFSKADFKYLNKNDIEDLYYLYQSKDIDNQKVNLMNSLITFIRSCVIWERFHDFQLGIESYQIKVIMDNPNITMEEYIRIQEEKALSRGEMFNWQTAAYGKMKYYENEDDCFTNFETKFPAIVLDNTLTSDAYISLWPPRDADKLSGMDLSGAPQSEKINNEQPNEGVCRVDKFEVIKYTIEGNEEFLAICTREYDSWAQTVNGVSRTIRRHVLNLSGHAEALVNTLLAQELISEKYHEQNIKEFSCAGDVVDFRTWPGISLETAMISTMDLDGGTCSTDKFLGLNQIAYMS